MKMKLPNKTTPMLLMGLALTIAYVMLAYLPLAGYISATRDALASQQAAVAQEAALLAQIEAYQTECREIEQYTASWPEVRDPNLHLSQLLGKISLEAKQAGADGLRLEPGQIQEMNAIQRIPVRLGCRGSFQEIHALIKQIEALPHKMWIDRLELAVHDEDKNELTCEMDFEAFVVSAKNSH